MKPSIRLISEMTGVSPATVSNALNNKRGVRRETAQRVLAAARECGYLAEARIKGIRLVLFKAGGLVLDDTPFFVSLIEGIEQESRAHGLEATVWPLVKDSPEFAQRMGELLNDNANAILLLGTEMTEADAKMFRASLAPIVVLDNWFEETDFDSVLISNTDSACKIVEYLIAHGHRQIGYLKGSVRIKNFFYREAGYLRALAKFGIPYNPAMAYSLTPTMDGAFADMLRLLNDDPAMPTAFFADNDIIALGAMKALQQQGIRVPGDVSVVGFDDMPFSSIASPPLTTIHVHKQEMGAEAVRRLMEISRKGSAIKTKTQICTEFVERDSVQPTAGN